MPTDVFNADVQQVLDAVPLAWAIALGVGFLIGLILWLLGGKLAKAGVVMAGFVLGGLALTSVALAWTAEGAAVAADVAAAGGAGGAEAAGDVAAAEGVPNSGGGGGIFLIALGVGGAIAGALLALLLYRLWIALTAAVVLAAVIPAAVLIWTGTAIGDADIESEPSGAAAELVEDAEDVESDVEVDEPAPAENSNVDEAIEPASLRDAVDDVRDAAVEAGREIMSDPAVAESLTGDLKTDLTSDEFKAAASEHAKAFLEVLRGVWAEQKAALGQWWDGLGGRQRTTVMGGAVLGGVLGLLLGLILPQFAASVQTALVGSVLMFFTGGALLSKFVSFGGGDVEGEVGAGSWLPTTPRAVLLTVGLITLIGLLLQCTVFKKKSDD